VLQEAELSAKHSLLPMALAIRDELRADKSRE